jgi:hypothetical protein
MDVVNSKYDKNERAARPYPPETKSTPNRLRLKEKLELLKQGLQAATEKYGEMTR